jgi:hypothetical protein
LPRHFDEAIKPGFSLGGRLNGLTPAENVKGTGQRIISIQQGDLLAKGVVEAPQGSTVYG